MRRELEWKKALAVSVFVLAAMALAGVGVTEVARRHWNWQPVVRVSAAFPTVVGLEPGARVLVQGIEAGAVESIEPPARPGGPVLVKARLDAKLIGLVRSDATARIATQGVVGAKVLEILPGAPDAKPLDPAVPLRSERPRELSDLMAEAETSLRKLDEVAESARAGLAEVNAIAGSISRGEGTVGKLVRDQEAYDRIVALSDRGETTLRDLSDNLSALKQTWPLTSYFERRGFEDEDRVLYQPGARREDRVFAEVELFEPGRAVLTQAGRVKLDALAKWFFGLNRPKETAIVIAAYTDTAPAGDESLARVLTEEQAEAVRDYLMDQHKIHSNGWFSSARKVAAVGYGTRPPRLPGGPSNALAPGQPARRVEFVIFTPKA
jgi:phospholipid/cholesterol/gamma-HCH transport system substrate-binding protein